MSGKINAFLEATRPKTLPASLIPVLMGGSIAYWEGVIYPGLLIITLICAVLIQIITNYINEIYDFKRGADTPERLGPRRMVASGVISPREMTIAVIILIAITFGLGMILVAHAGVGILAVGVLSLLFAWAYTGGPYPLAYNGLGDIFVLIFFGLVATAGTYYVQTTHLSEIAVISGFAPGFLSMNILGVNNLRDIETDPSAGKYTLSVRLGVQLAQTLYVILTVMTYAIPFIVGHLTQSLWHLLPLLSGFFAIPLVLKIYKKKGKELNEVLAGTGKLLMLYGLLHVAGFVLSRHFG
ncbi:MAG: 1,4-dihydroxy-2-naphthoate polyprenyltransferase [Candidatus Kapaibacterium sp.]